MEALPGFAVPVLLDDENSALFSATYNVTFPVRGNNVISWAEFC